MLNDATANLPMVRCYIPPFRTGLLVLLLLACRDKGGSNDSTRTLPPVFSSGPASSTNWDVDAGPLMLVSLGGSADSAAVVLPEITDSTIASAQTDSVSITGLIFDLFGRGGKINGSTTVIPVHVTESKQECDAWPLVRVRTAGSGWRVGFSNAHVPAIKLDSIEARSSTDSAAMAVSLAETAATLPIASDPAFIRLPFRVRSAYTFRLDSLHVGIAELVRSVNEETKPRIEHLLI